VLFVVTLTIWIGAHRAPTGVFGRVEKVLENAYVSITIPLILIGGPIWFLWRVVSIERERRQSDVRAGWIASGRCAECGYDLTGNISGTCPECGKGG
jgi:hypothetical protein